MGKKDVETVKYTSRNDVVADIINCTFYNGEHIVDEKDISEYDGRENILISHVNDIDFQHVQKFRDVLKKVHLLQPCAISDELLDSAESDFGRMMKLLKQQALNGEIEAAINKQKPYLLFSSTVEAYNEAKGLEQ